MTIGRQTASSPCLRIVGRHLVILIALFPLTIITGNVWTLAHELGLLDLVIYGEPDPLRLASFTNGMVAMNMIWWVYR